jgi:hypothetical protein
MLKRIDDDLPAEDRAPSSDTQAFEELVQRHERRVCRTAFAITGNQGKAEETFSRIGTSVVVDCPQPPW